MTQKYDIPDDNSLLILDDDGPFRIRLGRALTARGFDVVLAESIAQASHMVKTNPPA
ncbi:MAG TPA: two-component system response regulator, partial [Hellea balneolensis]|nr:two-component system response regulator [Hellea balneolensis]